MIEEVREYIKIKAEQFGAKLDSEYNKSYIERNNTGTEALKDNGAYFGFIHPEEQSSGPFHDFSLTIFPNDQGKSWLICLGIGSSGFKNDYELATYPGLRRLFSTFIDQKGFCKSDFSDIETSLPKSITSNNDLQHIKKTIKTYTKVLPVCQIVDDPTGKKGEEIIDAFVAGYAKLRDWPSNKDHRDNIAKALKPFQEGSAQDDIKIIKELLEERKFIVLQGAPGTGKTRAAKKVATQMNAYVEFIQFHAETTYSDFVYGIRPNLNKDELGYFGRKGALSNAIEYAKKHPHTNTVLIIDEINRANLSNVLGPVFYLFEYKMEESNVEIELHKDLKINKLPDNFYVIATMNTADRSLAVVDFALRRRFAWYNLVPKQIEDLTKPAKFFMEDFGKIQDIFNWYASSNELTLQPGQGYFIASSDDEMSNRIKYEIFPLIKEYLQEGLLASAKEEFNDYFSSRINKSLFE